MKVLIFGLFVIITLTCGAAKKDGDFNEEDTKEAEERYKFLSRITLECIEETKVDPTAARKLLLGNLSVQTQEAKCFIRCIFKREGFLNENDEPQIDVIVETLQSWGKLKPKALRKVIVNCSKFGSDDPCDSAFQLLQCYFQNRAVVKNVDVKTEL